MNIYKEEITEEIQEHCGYFNIHNTRAGLVDSTGRPQTSSNIKPLVVYDNEDKLHLLDSEENFHAVYSFQTSKHTRDERTTEVREVGQKRESVCDAFGRNAPSCLGSNNTSQNRWAVPVVSGSSGKKVTEFHITIGLTGGVWG